MAGTGRIKKILNPDQIYQVGIIKKMGTKNLLSSLVFTLVKNKQK